MAAMGRNRSEFVSQVKPAKGCNGSAPRVQSVDKRSLVLDEQTPQIVWQQYLVQRSFAFSPAAKPNGSLVPVSVSTLAAATDGNRCRTAAHQARAAQG